MTQEQYDSHLIEQEIADISNNLPEDSEDKEGNDQVHATNFLSSAFSSGPKVSFSPPDFQ